MTERPILFSGPMVRAILDGRKTQTRRVVKPQPPQDAIAPICESEWWMWQRFNAERRHFDGKTVDKLWDQRCPYGVPGDRLWVRETWRVGAWRENEGKFAVDYRADGSARREWLTVEDEDLFERLWIESSDDANDAGLECGDEGYQWNPGESPCRWRPSIFMPRWASRLTLEVVNVRVERLQEITPADAIAEGIPPAANSQTIDCDTANPVHGFRSLWDSINAKRAPWASNPWVWVVGFKLI